VVTGYAGAAGACLIAKKNRAQLEKKFRSDYIDKIIREDNRSGNPEYFEKCGVNYYRTVGEGGVLSELYRMGRERKAGMDIKMKQIPVLQSTVEISEIYGLNPYRLFSRCFILLSENGGDLVEKLNHSGIHAAVIGHMTKGPAKIITDKEETEYLNRPSEDEIRKVLKTAGSEETETKRAEAKRAEGKRAETKETETKRAEGKRAETKETETKRAEGKRAETKETETKRTAAKQTAAKQKA